MIGIVHWYGSDPKLEEASGYKDRQVLGDSEFLTICTNLHNRKINFAVRHISEPNDANITLHIGLSFKNFNQRG